MTFVVTMSAAAATPKGHWLYEANALLLLSVVLLAGAAAGLLSKRLKLPAVTGQILIGIIVGPAALHIVPAAAHNVLEPVIGFALGLMAVDVGGNLGFRRLRHAKSRLAWLVLFELTLTPLFVFAGVWLAFDIQWYMAHLLAAIAISTAPATVIALVKETNSRGVFVKTLVAAVALNNLVCILAYESARTMAQAAASAQVTTLVDLLLAPAIQLGKSLLLACVVGAVLVFVTRRTLRQDRLTAATLAAILFTIGLARHLSISVLLSCLILGVFLAKATPDKDELGGFDTTWAWRSCRRRGWRLG